MKRAQHGTPGPQSTPRGHPRLKPRDPVARSPLMKKGGVHEKTRGAKRRADTIAVKKLARDPELGG